MSQDRLFSKMSEIDLEHYIALANMAREFEENIFYKEMLKPAIESKLASLRQGIS